MDGRVRAIPAAVFAMLAAWSCGSTAPSGGPDVGGTLDGGATLDAGGALDARGTLDAAGTLDDAGTQTALEVIRQKDAFTTLYALSDVHGGYQRLASLLARHGVIAGAPASPEAAAWTAGDATLVVTGDLIDKGPEGLEVIALLRALQNAAAAAGGEVIVTLGNHEAEFLDDPENSKATASNGFDAELAAQHLMPSEVASDADPRGHWLRTRPIAARVAGWFFAHSGDTQGRTIAELEIALTDGLARGGYGDTEITGSSSILESKDWETAAGIGARYTAALGVEHLVFGHQPGALGPRGAIAQDSGGTMFRIDCGMSPDVNDSEGALLEVEKSANGEVASQLAADGTKTRLWP